MAAQAPPLPIDLAAAVKCLAERDERLKRLIDETPAFRLEIEETRSPYEALLESIAYQSISGKPPPPSSAASRPSAATAVRPRQRKCSSSARRSSARRVSRVPRFSR